jgi:hypothetical protein
MQSWRWTVRSMVGGPGLSRKPIQPYGVALDVDENVYIAVTERSRIERSLAQARVQRVASRRLRHSGGHTSQSNPRTICAAKFQAGVLVPRENCIKGLRC